jgi:hypothetical protein
MVVTLVNFGHPLTESHTAAIERLAGKAIEQVIERPAQFDVARPFADQARELLDGVGLTPTEWQTLPLLVNLPTLHVIAAVVLAELHGRCGYYPAVVRLRPVAGAMPPQFEVAEIINLQAIREAARNRR